MTLMMIYVCRKTPFFNLAYGSPHLWVLLHITKFVAFGCYYLFVMWEVQRDVVTVDLMQMKEKVRYTRFVALSFSAKLYLLFGTPSFVRAMLFPCIGELPLNGLEFEHEVIQGNVNDMASNFDPLTL